MTRPNINHEQQAFVSASELLRSLIAKRENRSERLERSDVFGALEVIGEASQAGVTPDGLRLEATALLGKAYETFNSRAFSSAVRDILRKRLEFPLPEIDGWGTADDRKYLAKAISQSDAGWVVCYAAKALAQAEISEVLSRDAWAEIAITRSETLASALTVISNETAAWLSSRASSAEFSYRKLKRVSDALARTLLTADVPTGRDFGKAFADMTRLAGGGKGSESNKVREESAISVLELLIQVLRLRFDVIFDSDIYRAAGVIRGWWRPARPPDVVEEKADRIANFAMRGLHILARQGVSDIELRQSLTASLGSERVNSAGSVISARDPSLTPELVAFLATGKQLPLAKSNANLREVSEQATDELLGHLLLVVRTQDSSSDLELVANALELFEPGQASNVKRANERLQLICQWVDALASKRGLSIYEARGSLVSFDPALHETSELLQRSSSVRVVTPGVLKETKTGIRTIIIKALVRST